MDGFNGINITSTKKLSIQRPIGFFGIAVVLSDAPNLSIQIVTSSGIPLRNTLVCVSNETSGEPDQKTTDNNGNVAVKSDSTTTISYCNGKFLDSYDFDRSVDGNNLILILHIPSLI